MAAVFKSECGKDNCVCTFLLLDFELAREWLNSFKQFLDGAKASLTNAKARTLFMPWTLKSLVEHEECFQQWCILQLLLGLLATIAYVLLAIVWNATTEHVKVSVGSILMDACVRFALAFLAAWLMWFGVVAKKGCCCGVACCCLGKPNILAVAIVEGLLALFTGMNILQALGHGHVLLIVAASIAVVHLVSQVYLTFEASMVWWNSLDMAATTKQDTVGPPVILGQKDNAEVKKAATTTEPKGAEVAARGENEV
jgi:hypothetical protein